MSIFNETILPQILDIPKTYIKAFNDDLKAARACLDKFKEEFKNGAKAREKAPQDKNVLTTLQIINEDEDEKQTNKPKTSNEHNSTEGSSEKRGSKKRSKNEVDGILSPEQDKRQKRNASVKAQSIISKQNQIDESVIYVESEVNVNLTQKLRRENSIEKARNRQDNDDDKENTQQIPAVRIKQEKISLPPEPEKMETVSLPLNIDVKQEPNRDGLAMPPPPAPVRKTRKGAKKQTEDKSDEESQMGARSKKQSEIVPVQRTTRSSSRTTKQLENEEPVIPETRPKRTRAKKATPNASIETTQDTTIASPADKRPKRTRRRRKSSDNQKEQPEEVEQPPEIISPKEERISQPEQNTSSPILPITIKTKNKKNLTITEKSVLENGIGEQHTIEAEKAESTRIDADPVFNEAQKNVTLDLETDNENGRNNKDQRNKEEKRDLSNLNATVTISNEVDKTIVIPDADAAYDQRDLPKANMINETVVLDSRASDTISSNKTHVILDATVVIERAPMATNITEDNSLLTDDDSIEVKTPPKKPPKYNPRTSAVKEKVQQFEELASRVTRTKTRALTKKDDANENQTPPDKVIKPALAPDTLTKMNNLIFNGKMPQVIQSASKITVSSQMKSFIPTSTSKLSGINKAREAAEESKKEKEDARRKKEALLEAKREMHRRKREEKMAAAAAAREAAERERRAALVAAAKEKHEKQLHADVTKLERQKEIERKRQELARKVAETEERRRAEENARQQRLEEEQKKKAEDRRKQLEEADAMKKEAALMEREIERKKREFQEKHKMKQRMEGEKIGTPLKYRMEPVYMEGGFQFLNSDEEASPVRRPEPAWSTSKNRLHMACLQDRLKTSQVDKLFSVREQTADLREIFPTIDRARLKRTSSAVWRTPPSRLAALPE